MVSLYELSVGGAPLNVQLRPNAQLDRITREDKGVYKLHFTQVQQGRPFVRDTNFVILATGYRYKEPEFLQGIDDRIVRTADRLYDVRRNYTIDIHGDEIFVQNAELHTHGFAAPDLGMGAYRNACIINTVTGKEIYHVERRIAFQEFGVDATG